MRKIEVKCFVLTYTGDNVPDELDIEEALVSNNIDEEGVIEVNTKKSSERKAEFTIRYIGTNLPKISEVKEALIDGNIDDLGMFKLKTIKPDVEICPACQGTGNVDEATGFRLDCVKCGGSGWVKK